MQNDTRKMKTSKSFSARSLSMLLNGGLHKSKKSDASSVTTSNSRIRLTSFNSMSSLTSASTISSCSQGPASPASPASATESSSAWSCLNEPAPTLALDFETSRLSDLAPEVLLKPSPTEPRKVMKRNGSVYIYHNNMSMDDLEAFNPFDECY